MKKSIVITLSLALIVALSVLAAGCGSDVAVYSVTVEGGTGGGNYYENANCQVIAQVPEGKQFLKWTIDGEDVSAQPKYVFTVKGNTELIAVFGDAVDNADEDVVTVKAVNGIGSGGYIKGSQCTVKVESGESDRSFQGWVELDAEGKEGKLLSTQNPYTFKADKNVEMVAKFNDERLTTPYGTLCRISSTPAWGDVIVELDRVKDENGNAVKDENGNPVTVFDGRVQYIEIHIFDSVYAAKSVASFKFVQEEDKNNAKFVTMDGSSEFGGIKGGPGNYYRDWIGMADFAPFMKNVIGESYSADTSYYFASRLIAVDTEVAWGEAGEMRLFANSGISGLNSEYFCEND